MKNFSLLEKKLKLNFKNKKLLIQSFCHRSYLNENKRVKLKHNERLEFLGDAVLELVVTDYLYRTSKKSPEGELTDQRALIVKTESLSNVSKNIGFNDFLLLSSGEAKDTGKARDKILADVFEAFIGALYLDKGYNACKKFIEKHLIKKLSPIIKKGGIKDAKSFLQEKTQALFKITPIYKILEEDGPAHQKYFKIGVFLNEELLGEGDGYSKKEAEENAAKKILEKKRWKE